jgi:hypothetical protein
MSFTKSSNIDKYILTCLLNVNSSIILIRTSKYSKNLINYCTGVQHDNVMARIIFLLYLIKIKVDNLVKIKLESQSCEN